MTRRPRLDPFRREQRLLKTGLDPLELGRRGGLRPRGSGNSTTSAGQHGELGGDRRYEEIGVTRIEDATGTLPLGGTDAGHR